MLSAVGFQNLIYRTGGLFEFRVRQRSELAPAGCWPHRARVLQPRRCPASRAACWPTPHTGIPGRPGSQPSRLSKWIVPHRRHRALGQSEGFLFLTGRLKEMINRCGGKMIPQEVDEALAGHPAVAEAAVFAVAHQTLREDVAAAVVLRRGAALVGTRAAKIRGHAPGCLQGSPPDRVRGSAPAQRHGQATTSHTGPAVWSGTQEAIVSGTREPKAKVVARGVSLSGWRRASARRGGAGPSLPPAN